jgi:hypothetical protein
MLHDFAKTGDIDGFINAVIHNNNTIPILRYVAVIHLSSSRLQAETLPSFAIYSTDQE